LLNARLTKGSDGTFVGEVVKVVDVDVVQLIDSRMNIYNPVG
jgi:hypothetical protein